jgi:hypothetical protein
MRRSHGNSWRNVSPKRVPDLSRAIKNEEAVWWASRMFQAHCREPVPAGFQKHLSPVHDEFLDLDRLFLAALHNPLNGEHRVASHSQLPRVAPAQLRVRSDGCVPIVESRPLLRRDEPRTFPIARGPNPCAEWGQRGAADRTRRRLMCSAFRAGRPGLRGRRAALTGENLEGRAGGTMLSPAPGKSNRQEHEGPLRTGMTERCRKLFQVGQIAGTSLSVNRSFASRVFRFKSLSAQSNEPLAAIFDARALNGAGRFFGWHQIMRSAFSPRTSISSTSTIEVRPAAASVSNCERYRHTAPRRAVGAIVKRTSRASDNVVIVRPSSSAIGTPNLRSQGMP